MNNLILHPKQEEHLQIEPGHNKTRFLPMQKQRCRSAVQLPDQRLCFRYTDSTIPLLVK